MIARSAAVSFPGLSRTASGMATLPTSCSGAAMRISWHWCAGQTGGLGEERRVTPHAFGVRAGLLVAELDGFRESVPGLGLRGLQAGDRAAQVDVALPQCAHESLTAVVLQTPRREGHGA